MKNWHEDKVCKLHIDYHTPGSVEKICRNFSADEVAEKIAGSGFDAVQFFSKGHFGNSYYPTKTGRCHPALKRDLFGELADALAKRNVTVMAYYSLRPDSLQAELHPDWTVKNELVEEEFAHAADNRAMCFQSPYLEEVALPQIREVAERYPIESFFFDFARSESYCGCQYCQKQYLKDKGAKLPPNDSSSKNWSEYVEWKRGEQDRVESLLEKAVHGAKPEALITVNYSYSIRNPKTVPDYYGFISMDVNERCSYALNVSLNSKYLAAKDKTWDIMTTRMINWWSGWGLKPINALLYQNAVILAHGGKTFLADRADIDWKLDDQVYSYFKKANDFIKELWDISRCSKLKVDAGIFLSRASYYVSDLPSNSPMGELVPVQGAHRILTMKHRQHLILDEDSLAKYIGQIKLLIIPEQSVIDDSSAKLIKEFVEKGGSLIASGSTLQSHPLMADILGVKDAGDTSRVFIKPPEWAVDEHLPSLEIAFDCPAKKIELSSAKLLSELYMPVYNLAGQGLGFGSPDRSKSFPGASENNYGKGKAIYISPDIFSCYIKINNPPIKHFIDKLVVRSLETPLLETDAYENIEFVMAEKDGGRLLHMINFAEERSESQGQTAMTDNLPETGSFYVKLRLAQEVKKITALPEGVPVKWQKEDDGAIKIECPSFKLYNCLMISKQ